jgi:hypothetical protein
MQTFQKLVLERKEWVAKTIQSMVRSWWCQRDLKSEKGLVSENILKARDNILFPTLFYLIRKIFH